MTKRMAIAALLADLWRDRFAPKPEQTLLSPPAEPVRVWRAREGRLKLVR